MPGLLVDQLAELTRHRDRERLDVMLAGALRDLLVSRVVTIWGVVGEGDTRRWVLRACQGPSDLAARSDPPWTDSGLLPLLSTQPERERCLTERDVAVQPGSAASTLLPLETDGESSGVVEIEAGAALTATELHLVRSILRIYSNFHELLDYSERDTLTGLLNRKTFDDSFFKVTTPSTDGSAARRPRVFLGMIDIDHFKSVNDRFGHLIGDEVLLLLSRLMRGSFRHGDRLYRFGGEEFVAMLRCTSVEEASLAFERLRLNVRGHAFPQVGQITVSIGYSEVRAGDTPSSALERADRAVYHAKSHGRDQVRDHASLVADGELLDHAKVGDIELF